MDRLLDTIGRQEQDLVTLCRRLVQISSENPPGDVREVATFVAETLTAWGIAPVWHEPAPGRANVVASIGPADGRALILNGHLDVVPAGEAGRWSHPPFAGEVSGGLLYGRGAVDMKGGVAALMVAFRVLAATTLPGRIILALTADEESGGRWGTRWLVERAGLRGDGALIAEPSGPGIATIGQKGVLWLRVKSVGTAAHGSLSPYAGRNAILRLTEALPIFTALAGRAGDFPDALRPILQRSKIRMAAVVGAAATQALDHVTVNIGTVRGGTKVNVVPDEAVAEIDIRVPHGCSAAAIRSEIETSLAARDLILEACTVSEPNYTDPEAAVARALAQAVEVVAGQRPEFLFQWATSDARHFRAAGIPVVQYGPWGQGIHGDDEAVYIDHLTHCAKVYAILGHTFLTMPPGGPPPTRP